MPKPLTFFRWRGGSGEIRGAQVAEYLGARCELIIGHEMIERQADAHRNDKCIFVKGQPPENFPPGSYLDMMDAKDRFSWIDGHPGIKLIGISKTAIKCMRNRLGREDIHFIPEHHCNYERERRQRDEIKRCGVIGNNNAFWGFCEDIGDRFLDMGLEFEYRTQYKGRQDPINFYRGIDIQCVWRPHLIGHDSALRNPLKLDNAGSFGIPTVAYPEESYLVERKGCFVPALTLDDMFRAVKRLQTDPVFYRDMSQAASEGAERHHIERTSKLYLALP